MRIYTLRCNDALIIAHLIYAMQFNARDQTYRYQFSRFEEIGQVDWLHTFINQLFKECLCFFIIISSLLALHIELCSYGDFNGIDTLWEISCIKIMRLSLGRDYMVIVPLNCTIFFQSMFILFIENVYLLEKSLNFI